MRKVNILLVDDELLLLESLELILSLNPEFEVVGLAIEGKAALHILEDKKVDVVLVDLNMEGMGGQELIQEIKKRYKAIKLLVLTTFYDEVNIVQAIQNGADGYLLKGAGREQITQGIHNLISGQSVLDSKVMHGLAKAMNKYNMQDQEQEKDNEKTVKGLEVFDTLTPREIEICHMIAEGYTNGQIASFLFISNGTVKNYMSSIYDKTGIKDRALLAVSLAKILGE